MIQLIKAAALGVNKEERVLAENQIIQLRLEKTEEFFFEACNVLKNQQLPSDLRQAAGTVVTLSVAVETQPKTYLWDNLQPHAKQSVKDAVLSVMIDHDRNIRRAAANVVAAICCIEIPRNEWEGIVEKISSNINNEDLLIKQVSILTLGFICERLREKKSFVFNEHLQQLVLTGILLGLKQSSKQIVETSLKALRDGLGSMPDILTKPQYRDYLINQTVQIISKPQHRNFGLQILNQFTRVCYQHLDHYMNGFITLLEPIIKNYKDEENCIQAIEFWQELAAEYKFRSENDMTVRNYVTGEVGTKVVTWLLEALCAIDQDKDDGEENGVDDAAAKCLETIFEEDSQEFEKLVLDFTSNTIDHANPKYRQASIRAFASFLIGADQKRKQQLVNASLVKLVSLLNDDSKMVQYSAIKSINLISEQCAQSFLHHVNFLDILKLVVAKLSLSAAFLNHACKIIDNLCAICIENEEKHFTNLADDLIQVLFSTCLTTDSTLHTINCCICTIMNLITACQNPDVCKKEIEFVLTHFGSISQLDSERRERLYSSFFTLLQTALLALRRDENIPMETLSTIYDLVIKHFSNIKRVDSDGLYVVGSISFYFRTEPRLIDDFWKYIEYALTQYNQSFTFKAGLSCVCDFAANYGPDLGDKIPLLMKHLIDSFQKPQVSRDSKLDVIMAIGDMFLNCGPLCSQYLDQVMSMLMLACQASINMDDSEKHYAQNLRQHIIQTFTCILHGCNFDQTNPYNQLLPYVQNIFKFIEFTTDKSLHPKINYLKSCIMWMADLSRIYKVKVQHWVRQRWVYDCLELLKKNNKNHAFDRAIQYAKENF